MPEDSAEKVRTALTYTHYFNEETHRLKFYSRPNVDPEERREHKSLMDRIHSVQRFNEEESFDPALHFLLMMIAMFSTSSLVLKNVQILDGIQTKYAMLLFRYLKSKMNSKAYLKFDQGLMSIETSRKAYKLHHKMAISW